MCVGVGSCGCVNLCVGVGVCKCGCVKICEDVCKGV